MDAAAREQISASRRTFRLRSKLRIRLCLLGLLIGSLTGFLISAYRLLIEKMSGLLQFYLGHFGTRLWGAALLLVCYLGIAALVSWLCHWEPMIGGSGIPQISGILSGRLECRSWRVLFAKFTGGVLCLGSGLTLGREGPSVQLGGALAQGLARLLKRPLSERRFLLSAGAAAGLSAAFNAPISGVIFCLEELHRSFSIPALISAMAAAFASDFVAVNIFGIHPVLHFQAVHDLRLELYPLLILLGAVCACSGVAFNRLIQRGKALYAALPLSPFLRRFIPFVATALVALLVPALLFSGEPLIFLPEGANLPLAVVLALYVAKFLLLLLAFCSGLPGGIFFPLLILGSLLGNLYAQLALALGLIGPNDVLILTLLAMCAHFTAIVRSPLTGIMLITEMSGSFAFMLPLGVVALSAFLVADGLKCRPVYEMLLDALLAQKHQAPPAERLLIEYPVEHGSRAEGCCISEIAWPEHCLFVGIKRGSEELLPRGSSRLEAGDYLLIYLDRSCQARVEEGMAELCRAHISLLTGDDN